MAFKAPFNSDCGSLFLVKRVCWLKRSSVSLLKRDFGSDKLSSCTVKGAGCSVYKRVTRFINLNY